MKTNMDLIQKIFEDSKKSLKSKFELNLSLIEQVALRCFVRVCLEEQSQCKYPGLNYPSVGGEAESRFMSQYYGTPILDEDFLYFCEDLGLDKVQEYFRRIQERSHLP